MTKMNFDRDFALAREMIVKMCIFREFLLDLENFVSGMSFVSFFNDFV